MGTCSSGEDLVIKARKPYTITKQREKWTEEEHNRFLEALKLYGRAWQRIEEHIGTKTAVQIRSHAQKFFSKLEKEAVAKGIPLGEAHDIEIPPPRPKRKPNNPYPRKVCVGAASSCGEGNDGRTLASLSSLCSKAKAMDSEGDDHHEKHTRSQTLERNKETTKDSECSVSLSLFQDAPITSIPCACNCPLDDCLSGEFSPPRKEIKDKATVNEYSPPVKDKVPDDTDQDVGRLNHLSIDAEMKLPQQQTVGLKLSQKNCMPLKNEVGSSKSYPKHIPVYSIVGDTNKGAKCRGSDATDLTSLCNEVGVHTNSNFGSVPTISANSGHHDSTSMSSVHQTYSAFSPFTQFFGTQDACRSFLNISSTFSSLIISTLLQNPAAHSTASLAASFWPTSDVETPVASASETFVGGVPERHVNTYPSTATIAAATVAAASAWWATHGMLPFCHPAFHSFFLFAPPPTSIIPRTETAQDAEDNREKEVEVTHDDHTQEDQQAFDPEFSEVPGTKSSPLLLSESDECQERGRPHGVGQRSLTPNPPNSTSASCLHEFVKARSKKKVEHSFCGSNMLSNSEMETDSILKNLEEGKGEPKDVHLCHPSFIDSGSRRSRGSSNVNESWKEVSEEGRLAFQALFSRDVLPQSFSPPHIEDGMMENVKEKEAPELPMEQKGNACASIDNHHPHVAGQNCSAHEGNSVHKGLLTNEIGQGKFKWHRTGFKPYKRCSMEAKESKADPVEEKCNKRIRLEGEASM